MPPKKRTDDEDEDFAPGADDVIEEELGEGIAAAGKKRAHSEISNGKYNEEDEEDDLEDEDDEEEEEEEEEPEETEEDRQKKKQKLDNDTQAVVEAIRALKAHNGSSPAAIGKYLKDRVDKESIKEALVQGVEDKLFTKIKGSYIVTSDPRYPDLKDKITFEEIVPPTDPTSKAVVKGHTVYVKYKGMLKATGEAFDEDELKFLVDGGEVIRGLDQGVIGMRVGSKRIVQIPASLGYGKRGSPPEIPSNADLVFEIELNKIK
ncbi:hypothetical protein HDU79_002794 [Rhizoclosmatium sp. JEL0117]|nr:hypothetical protein HDU79_002794 [Rhizoclosmatium sp. JEL0117]